MSIQPMNNPSTFKPRINLQVMQTATDRRFALLILAILSTSLYIFHTELVAGLFASQLESCIIQINPGSGGLVIDQVAFACSWVPYTWIVLGLLMSTLLVFGIAVLIFSLRPELICRRAHLKPLGIELNVISDALNELRQFANLPSSLHLCYVRDPLLDTNPRVFSGLSKHYFTVPNSLILLYQGDKKKFKSIVLHEFAHLYNKDSAKADFAIAIAYAFTFFALAPFLIFLIWSLFHLGTNPVAGREFVLLQFLDLLPLVALIFFTYTSIWRSREMYADIQAIQ